MAQRRPIKVVLVETATGIAPWRILETRRETLHLQAPSGRHRTVARATAVVDEIAADAWSAAVRISMAKAALETDVQLVGRDLVETLRGAGAPVPSFAVIEERRTIRAALIARAEAEVGFEVA